MLSLNKSYFLRYYFVLFLVISRLWDAYCADQSNIAVVRDLTTALCFLGAITPSFTISIEKHYEVTQLFWNLLTTINKTGLSARIYTQGVYFTRLIQRCFITLEHFGMWYTRLLQHRNRKNRNMLLPTLKIVFV